MALDSCSVGVSDVGSLKYLDRLISDGTRTISNRRSSSGDATNSFCHRCRWECTTKTYCEKILVVSVTLVTSVVLWIIVWFCKPGPEYVSVNWNAAPGVVCVKVGLSLTPVHDDVTPSIVTLFVPVPGERLPEALTPLPVTEY